MRKRPMAVTAPEWSSGAPDRGLSGVRDGRPGGGKTPEERSGTRESARDHEEKRDSGVQIRPARSLRYGLDAGTDTDPPA